MGVREIFSVKKTMELGRCVDNNSGPPARFVSRGGPNIISGKVTHLPEEWNPVQTNSQQMSVFWMSGLPLFRGVCGGLICTIGARCDSPNPCIPLFAIKKEIPVENSLLCIVPYSQIMKWHKFRCKHVSVYQVLKNVAWTYFELFF
jgi:hypothetical protein